MTEAIRNPPEQVVKVKPNPTCPATGSIPAANDARGKVSLTDRSSFQQGQKRSDFGTLRSHFAPAPSEFLVLQTGVAGPYPEFI